MAAAVRWLIFAYAALSLVEIVVELAGYDIITRYFEGRATSAELDQYDLASAAISLPSLVIMILSAIFWAIWQYRAASAIPRAELKRSPGWHAGSWFIPVVSFWFPFQNIKNLVRVSGAQVSLAWLGVWWGLWLASSAASWNANRLTTFADTQNDVLASIWMFIMGSVLLIAATPFAWRIVRRITDALDPAAV